MRGSKPLILAGVFALAGFLLHRILSRYSLNQLTAAVTTVPIWRLLSSGGFAAASYFALTRFDYLALHYVDRPLPYFRAALASFTSLSLGHNIGSAALSSGAIRYRFYARWGLTRGQIAKLIVFCGVTVGLGLSTLGGAALLIRSELAQEITGLARPLVVGLGVGCLAIPFAYLALAAVRRRPLVVHHWTLEIPSPSLAAGQVAVGASILPWWPRACTKCWQRSRTSPTSGWRQSMLSPTRRPS
ncbi:lysylphosphatidylglycerol synthase transmembrane domain-containing protein [Microvirga sp. M2]|uniref:lysylphosphatidylglycerol synthase transmembrane domain-containing protein n=1 Tax=Microvirga sp. M2 TaxID=3073270 RepID=UPI0039C3BE84